MKRINKNPKIAFFHAFLQNKGGAEKVVIDICKHYNADMYVGGVRSDIFNADSDDVFSKEIFHTINHFEALHEDAKTPGWKHIKRQLNFLLNPKVNKLKEYDIVIFSGNVAFVQGRLKSSNTKTITYCHTPPRLFADQKERALERIHPVLHPFYNLFARFVMYVFKRSLTSSDVVIGNSQNISKRIKKFTGLTVDGVYPGVYTDKFKFISHGDFYLSHSRLEDMKRIRLIVEAFKQMPDQKLVLCSSGPLKNWLEEEIRNNPHNNIEYKGMVSNEELFRLVGTCKAGVIIPVEEDAGMVQCEVMAAGKPVLGVAEGGLLETIVHKKTGYLIPSDPTLEELIEGIKWMEAADTESMKNDCIAQAKKFDATVFFDKLDQIISNLYVTE